MDTDERLIHQAKHLDGMNWARLEFEEQALIRQLMGRGLAVITPERIVSIQRKAQENAK